MNVKLSLEVLIPTIAVIVGWFAVHWFTARRDHENKRRDMQIEYLFAAYRRLESNVNRTLTCERAVEIESACADVQLLGTPHQIELVQTCMNQLRNTGKAKFDDVLYDLRKTLRRELKLPPVEERFQILRMSASTDK